MERQLKMGLGEALTRLLQLEIRFRHGVASPELERERTMLLSALNRVEIQLGFDCNNDGIPDSIDLFRESSETSCCRLVDLPGARPVSDRYEEPSSSRAPDPPPVAAKPIPAPTPAPKAPTPPRPISSPGAGVFGRLFQTPGKK